MKVTATAWLRARPAHPPEPAGPSTNHGPEYPSALVRVGFALSSPLSRLCPEQAKQLGVTRTTVPLLLFAAVPAAAALHERITVLQVIGGTAILAASISSSKEQCAF
jgi:drug/metabolite transporter (DMT)-like permease